MKNLNPTYVFTGLMILLSISFLIWLMFYDNNDDVTNINNIYHKGVDSVQEKHGIDSIEWKDYEKELDKMYDTSHVKNNIDTLSNDLVDEVD